MAKTKQLLTTKEFSQKAGVSPTTVSSWLKKGKIKGKKEGNKWLIPESELKKSGAAKPAAAKKAAKTKSKPKAAPAKKKAAAKKTKPKSTAKPAKKVKPAGSGKTFSVQEFSDMTFLTEFGVQKWLKEGRLTGDVDASGTKRVDASNLENETVKRLLR